MGDASYSFASNPRPVAASRAPFREPEDNVPPAPTNLMFDPRVRRGHTYGPAARSTSTTTAGGVGVGTSTGAGAGTGTGGGTRTLKPRRRKPQGSVFDVVAGEREREPLSLEQYLVEHKDGVEEAAVTTQTDAFVELPAPAPYVPKKTGVDAATQIEPEDGLFDFDTEVEPILDVIVGKTLEQAVLEVAQEAELASLSTRKSQLHAARDKEGDRVKGMETKAVEAHKAKQRLLTLERARLARKQQALSKVVAVDVGLRVARSAIANVLRRMDAGGMFKDPVREAIESSFMPSLYKRVQQQLGHVTTSQAVADSMLHTALARGIERHEKRLANEAAAREAERKRLEEERKRAMRVLIRLAFPDGSDTMVGPVVVRRSDSVGEAEAKIQQWLVDNPKPETEPLLSDDSKELHLCVDGKPLKLSRLLVDCITASSGALELLPLSKDGAAGDGDDG